jgi:hypothetical protein
MSPNQPQTLSDQAVAFAASGSHVWVALSECAPSLEVRLDELGAHLFPVPRQGWQIERAAPVPGATN